MPKLNPKAGPLVAKGVVFPFPVCAVCWFDLLGYGTMIADADFNPLHSRASEALARLRRFHAIVASHSGRLFRTLVMNDGAAAYRDLSMRGSDATLDFLVRCLALFREVKSDEEKHSLPGPRAVLAVGFRMRGRRAGIDETVTQFSSVMRRFKDGKISAEQGLREAARIRPTFDVVPELQANFAFTKAYVAETSGSRGKLFGPNLFVDLAIFNVPMPSWVVVGRSVSWSHERLRMKAEFAPIVSVSPPKDTTRQSPHIRDASEIAQEISHDPDILRKLRRARKSSQLNR